MTAHTSGWSAHICGGSIESAGNSRTLRSPQSAIPRIGWARFRCLPLHRNSPGGNHSRESGSTSDAVPMVLVGLSSSLVSVLSVLQLSVAR
jgi:hypothetical protein